MKWIFVILFSLTAGVGIAMEIKPYPAYDFAETRQSGNPGTLYFYADWCPTCRAQQKVIFDLREQAGRIAGVTDSTDIAVVLDSAK